MTTTTDVDLVQTGLAHLIHHTRKQIESLTKALDHLPDVSELQLKGTLLKTYASQIEGHHHFVELPDYQGHPLSIKLDIKNQLLKMPRIIFIVITKANAVKRPFNKIWRRPRPNYTSN